MKLRSLFAALLLTACSSAADDGAAPIEMPSPGALPSPDAGSDQPPAGESPLSVRREGVFARKVLPTSDAFVVLWEKVVVLREAWGQPSRTIGKVDARGVVSALYTPAGRELVDVAVHPWGDLTLLEASKEGWFLVRLDPAGVKRAEQKIIDEAILSDLPKMVPHESTSPIEERTHDVGRITADGEEIFGATRTGRHSVVAYRWSWNGADFERTARTLVVPAHSIIATAIYGGTYDTFGQLEAHYGVFVGVDADHVGYVGTGHARLHTGQFAKAHKLVFGETLEGDIDGNDVYVSRVGVSGERLGTSVVGTDDDEQLYELRAGKHGVYALGRSEVWNEQGTGFEALAAYVAADGKVTMRRFDVSLGDIAFDAVEEADGSLFVAGASGYGQNPSGASIGDVSHAFVRRVRADGSTEAVETGLASGAGHNVVRSLNLRGDRLFVAGMYGGPGTHTYDGNPAGLHANGWLQEVTLPPSMR